MVKSKMKTIDLSPTTNTLIAGTVNNNMWQGKKIQLTEEETQGVVVRWIAKYLEINEGQSFVGTKDVIRIERISKEKFDEKYKPRSNSK